MVRVSGSLALGAAAAVEAGVAVRGSVAGLRVATTTTPSTSAATPARTPTTSFLRRLAGAVEPALVRPPALRSRWADESGPPGRSS